MYQNKAILIGFLGGDAEVRTGKNNQKFTTLSLATKTSYKDKESGEYISHTEWHRCYRLRQARRVRGHAQEGRAHPDRGRDSPLRVHAQEGEEAGAHRLDSRQLHPQARPRGEGRRGRAGSQRRVALRRSGRIGRSPHGESPALSGLSYWKCPWNRVLERSAYEPNCRQLPHPFVRFVRNDCAPAAPGRCAPATAARGNG